MAELKPTCSIKILGIDPETITTGYGVISIKGNLFNVHDYGCIKPPISYKLSDRYHIIDQSIESLIENHRPDVFVVENTIYSHIEEKKYR